MNIFGYDNKIIFSVTTAQGLWKSIPIEVVGAKKPQPKTPNKSKLLF